MDNTKIGNKEAIALLVTIAFNHMILSITKSIISFTGSASLLNILYVGVITIIFTCIICYFLNKFPTFDLIDISKYLGGNTLKWFIGILYIAYFIFFSGILLHIFSSSLQIIYFPITRIFYISLFFIIGAASLPPNPLFSTITANAISSFGIFAQPINQAWSLPVEFSAVPVLPIISIPGTLALVPVP